MSVPAERRRYERYEIKLRGHLARADGRQTACLVRDYCSGGMLVQLLRGEAGKVEPAFQVGQSLQLITELLTGTGSRAIQIGADVAWIRGEYLGLSFPRVSNEVVEALRRHDRLARPQVLPKTGKGTAGAARSLAKLRHVAKGALPGLQQKLLLMTGEALLLQADRVSSNTEQQQIFGDMTALEGASRGDALVRAVLTRAFDPDSTEVESQSAVDGLSLIDADEFERWLEASRVAGMLDRKFNARLTAIGSRISSLGAVGSSGTPRVPFEPQHFTGALKEFAQGLELGTTARRVLFDCAGSLLADRLEGFYGELDAALDASGAPPAQLDERVTMLRPAKVSHEVSADEQAGAAPGPVGPACPPAPGGVLRSSAAVAAPGLIAMDQEMLDALLARETRQRENLAGDLMALVSDVPGMTESLAGWLNQLREPLAREAVVDQTFFQNKHHPLREIVDGLGHLQMFRPVPDLKPADDPIQQRVGEILRPISGGQTDPQSLRSVADAVRDLVSDHSSRYQRNVERVAETCEGRNRVRRARRAVLSEIRLRYSGRRVPELLPQLLDTGWRAVMELAALNSGGDGEARYQELLGLLDSLVATLGGEAFDRDPLEPDANRLFVRIAKELTTVAFDPIRRNALETSLRKALAAPAQPAVDLLVMPQLEDEPGEEPNPAALAAPPDGVGEKAWTQVIERCRALSVGDRVRMLDAADAWQELRVAWVRSDHGVFALVDYRGLKVRETGLAELALDLHRHRVELSHSDGRALSDRGVDEMLARMEDRLAHQAAHDSLTGLMNRQQFHSALEQALATPGRAADNGVLLWIDIDQFRLVNDIHGYDTGDRLLVAVARRLEAVEGAGALGHMGADRFGVMLPDIGLAEGEQRAQGVCESVRDMVFDWAGPSIALSVSLGVVGMDAARAGASQLLQAADDALSAAKAAGGDRGYVYRADDPEIARRKESVRWVVQVDEALDRGQLRLRCQPIVPVRPDRGLSAHYEVLLGVHNGSSEPLPIAEFIDAAERYNRMRAVDRWVAQTVMEWVAAHREHMPALHGFAVNLSGQTASDPSFVEFVRQQFQRTGIAPSWISFEVTETAAVADLTRSAGIIHDLKSMGCKVALDDFGSGLASYSYLKELPVDWLKIDGVFVRKIAGDREDHAVVKSINEIGHFLGKKTIAEYVADDAILRLVREMGVDYAQGFGISPPLLMDDLPQTLLVASTG